MLRRLVLSLMSLFLLVALGSFAGVGFVGEARAQISSGGPAGYMKVTVGSGVCLVLSGSQYEIEILGGPNFYNGSGGSGFFGPDYIFARDPITPDTIETCDGVTDVQIASQSGPSVGNLTASLEFTYKYQGDSYRFSAAADINAASYSITCVTTCRGPIPAPTAAVALSPGTISLNGTSTVTVTLANTATGNAALTGVSDTVTLPSDVTVASTAASTTTCPSGSVSASGSGIALSGATLAAGASCTFRATVTSSTVNPSGYSIPTGAPSATESGAGTAGTPASLVVNSPAIPVLTFAIPNAASVTMGGTLTNAATSTLTGGHYGAIGYASNRTAVATVDPTTGAITPIAPGTTTITATQAAVPGFNVEATQTYLLTVGKVLPAIALSASSTSVVQGVSVTFTATVSGGVSPKGSVTFKDGGTVLTTVSLSGGKATYTTTALAIGTHTITAVYSGDRTNASVSSPALSVTVGARPDPSADPTVKAMVTSQVTTAARFAQAQIDNTVRRLEEIHDETDDGDDPAKPGQRQAAGPSGNGGASPPNGSASRSAGTGAQTASASDGGQAKTYTGPDYMSQALAFGDESEAGRSSQSDTGRAIQKVTQAFAMMEKKANLPFHLWTAGSLDFGKMNLDRSYDNRFSTTGLTVGLDKRIADGLTAGLALGYGLDHTTFGSDGSKQDATAHTAMLYGSWRMTPKTFLDVTGGYGTLHFDEKRWSTGGNVMLSGTRDGRAAFGSAGLTRSEKWDAWKVSGYGRLDVVRVMLDDYSETGSNLWALAYDKLTTTTVSAVAGLKADYKIAMEWGSLTPGARLEYRHAFEGGFTQTLGYADLGTMPYAITGTPAVRDAITAGLSLRAMTLDAMGLDLEYLLTSDTHTVSNQQVRASVRIAF